MTLARIYCITKYSTKDLPLSNDNYTLLVLVVAFQMLDHKWAIPVTGKNLQLEPGSSTGSLQCRLIDLSI